MDEAGTERAPEHEELQGLVALAALEGLTPAEMRQVQSHLAACAECREAFAGYCVVAGQLALSVPRVEAPTGMEERLRAALHPEPAARPVARRRWRQPAWWLAAAAVLAALLLGAQNLALRRELAAEQAQTAALAAALTSAEAHPILMVGGTENGGAGRFVWASGNPIGSLVVTGLPPAGSDQVYCLWLIRKDGTIDNGGVFEVGPDGTARLTVDPPVPWRDYDSLGISLQPLHDAYELTNPLVLRGDF